MNINKALKGKFVAKLGHKRTIKGIVLHDTAGSGTHNDTRYLADPGDGRKVSVDFTVERDGTVYQLNPDVEMNYCYHAGRNTHFKDFRNAEVNVATVGIEIVQKANLSLVPIWPEAQIKAVAELCQYLCMTHRINKADITTHQAIITDGSRSDPRKFPFTSFWAFFNARAGESPVMSGVILAEPVYHEVKDGDTLSALSRKYATTIEKLKALNDMNTADNTIYKGHKLLVKE